MLFSFTFSRTYNIWQPPPLTPHSSGGSTTYSICSPSLRWVGQKLPLKLGLEAMQCVMFGKMMCTHRVFASDVSSPRWGGMQLWLYVQKSHYWYLHINYLQYAWSEYISLVLTMLHSTIPWFALLISHCNPALWLADERAPALFSHNAESSIYAQPRFHFKMADLMKTEGDKMALILLIVYLKV